MWYSLLEVCSLFSEELLYSTLRNVKYVNCEKNVVFSFFLFHMVWPLHLGEVTFY